MNMNEFVNVIINEPSINPYNIFYNVIPMR